MPDTGASNAADEAFAVGFEVRTLADQLLRGGVERWVPNFCAPQTDVEHRARYAWASRFVVGQAVLDVASGCGLGSHMLASAGARHVLGCDIDAAAVRYASVRYRHDALAFRVGNAETLRTNDAFDVVVSFETIEHVSNLDAYLDTVVAALAPQGRYLVSTPISARDIDEQPSNSFHVREWGFAAFQRVIGARFAIDEIYVQLYPAAARPGLVRRVAGRVRRELTGGHSTPRDAVAMDVVPWDGREIPRGGFQILACTRR